MNTTGTSNGPSNDGTLKSDIEAGLTRLRGMRDEMRLQLHLGGLDAKDKLATIEAGLDEIEGKVRTAADAGLVAVRAALLELERALGNIAKGTPGGV